MPNLGYETGTEVAWTGAGSDGDHVWTTLPSMPEAGTLDSVSLYYRNGNQFDRETIFFIADAAENILGTSSAVQAPASPAWVTLDFSSLSIVLSDGVAYKIGLLKEASATQMRRISQVGIDVEQGPGTWDTVSDPLPTPNQTWSGNAFLGYITYTAGGGIPPAPNNPGNEQLVVAADMVTTPGSNSFGEFLTSPNPADGDYIAFPTLTDLGGVVTPVEANGNPTGQVTIDYTGLGFVPPTDEMTVDYYDGADTETWLGGFDVPLIDGDISTGAGILDKIIGKVLPKVLPKII